MEVNAKRIPLSKGLFAWVSEEDFDRVSKYKWHANLTKTKRGDFYYARGWIPKEEVNSSATLSQKGTLRHILLHRFVLNLPDEIRVDHEDLDCLNCTRSNLRVATNAENLANSKVKGKAFYKGVGRISINCYEVVALWKVGLPYCFKEPIQAAKAYDDYAREKYGKFARLNFPLPGERSALR